MCLLDRFAGESRVRQHSIFPKPTSNSFRSTLGGSASSALFTWFPNGYLRPVMSSKRRGSAAASFSKESTPAFSKAWKSLASCQNIAISKSALPASSLTRFSSTKANLQLIFLHIIQPKLNTSIQSVKVCTHGITFAVTCPMPTSCFSGYEVFSHSRCFRHLPNVRALHASLYRFMNMK